MVLKWLVPVAGVACAAAASAQDYTPAPAQIQGEISASDEADGQGRRYDDIPVELVRGQRIMITAAPAAGSRVAPGLEIRAYGGSTALARRSAEGDARTARLAFTPPQSGVFNIRVVSGSPAAGRYTVAIQRTTAPSLHRGPTGITAGVPTPVPSDPTTGSAFAGPLSRFIVCPGHPRCPR